MKKSILFLIIACGSLGAVADVIVMADGTTMQVHNVEPASKWIYYTESSDADAPIKKVAIEKVFAYKIGDGQMTTVAASAAPTPAQPQPVQESAAQNGPRKLDPAPAADNASLIGAYNTPELRLRKPKKESDKEKFCTDFITLWGIGSESVISDENVNISFQPDIKKANGIYYPYYKVKVTNKTDSPVYIDLANSFKLDANGSAEPYFTNSVYSESNTKSGGMGLNLGAVAGALGIGGVAGTLAGGMSVGSGSANTATVTSQEQRFLMIPPRAAVYMPPVKFSDGSKILEQYDVYFLRNTDVRANTGMVSLSTMLQKSDESKPYYNAYTAPGALDDAGWTRDKLAAPLGWTRSFSEAESPKKLTRLITYSTNPDFTTYTILPVSIYLRGVIGSNLRNVPNSYNPEQFECTDDSHLIWGLGQVKKK